MNRKYTVIFLKTFFLGIFRLFLTCCFEQKNLSLCYVGVSLFLFLKGGDDTGLSAQSSR